MPPSGLWQRPRPELIEFSVDSYLIICAVNRSEAGNTVFEVDVMREPKIIEEKRDNKIGDEWEIAERPGPELTPNSGNTMAQVDRSSAYSNPDRDKQFKQKNSESPEKERRDEISSEKIVQREDAPDRKKDADKDLAK